MLIALIDQVLDQRVIGKFSTGRSPCLESQRGFITDWISQEVGTNLGQVTHLVTLHPWVFPKRNDATAVPTLCSRQSCSKKDWRWRSEPTSNARVQCKHLSNSVCPISVLARGPQGPTTPRGISPWETPVRRCHMLPCHAASLYRRSSKSQSSSNKCKFPI